MGNFSAADFPAGDPAGELTLVTLPHGLGGVRVVCFGRTVA
jgi:hypothetical protein